MRARTGALGQYGLLGFVLALIAMFPLHPAPAQSVSALPSAEVVYVETDPWVPIIGSESPNFALYSDGTVIFRVSDGYRSVKLSPEQHASFLSGINLSGLETYYDFSNGATDQLASKIFDFRGNQANAISLYGNIGRGTSNSPRNLSQALNQIRQFKNSSARPWLPEMLEVMVWPYDDAPDGSIDWPRDWPDLRHPSTRSRGENMYSLFIPSSKAQELNAFLATRKQRGAVRISGREFAVSLRYPFPGETRWMGPR